MQRRSLIKTLMASAGVWMLAPLGHGGIHRTQTIAETLCKPSEPGVFIFQDRAHFDAERTDNVEPYIPPKAMASTKRYLDSIDNKTFLERHWFV